MRKMTKVSAKRNRIKKWSKSDQLKMLVVPKGRIAYKLKDMVSAIRKTLLRRQ
jgi:hypothetical protein